MKRIILMMLLTSLILMMFSCDKTTMQEDGNTKLSCTSSDNSSRFESFESGEDDNSDISARTFKKESAPSIPADAINMLDVDGNGTLYNASQVKANTNYYLPAGAQWTKAIKFDTNTNYYIQGDLDFVYWGTDDADRLDVVGGEVYVLHEGSISITQDAYIRLAINIKCWGSMTTSCDVIHIGEHASIKIYKNEELTVKKLVIHGVFTTVGNLNASEFEVASSDEVNVYRVNIGGDLSVENLLYLSLKGTLIVNGNTTANEITVSVFAKAQFKGCVTVHDKLYCAGDAKIWVNNYLKTEEIVIANNVFIFLKAGTLVESKTITYSEGSSACFYNGDMSAYAVISCETLIPRSNMNRMQGGPIDLHAKTINNSGSELEWTANVIFNGPTKIEANDCHEGFSSVTEQPEEKYNLTHIALVRSPNTDKISATSIDFKNGKAFISWHERGDAYQGYLDVVNIDSKKINATYSTTELDFNHIYVAEKLIYVTGGGKKGAFYTEVNYSNTSSSLSIEVVEVAGASGNCILQETANQWVISGAQGGITIAPENNFIPLEQAKYIVKYGDNMAVLAGIENTSIYEYSMTGEELKSYNVGSIPDSDGKNALFVDNDVIYAALGANGLKAFKNGAPHGEYANLDGGSVNCVDVDENFIYIANGTAGLYILDKTDFSLIKSYKFGDASANFVKKGADGLIYLAYGLKGVHTFKLTKLAI